MELLEVWPQLIPGISGTVLLSCCVVNIDVYLPSQTDREILCEVMPILKKRKILFCYDLTLKTDRGKLIKVLLSPLLSSIQKRILKIKSYLIITNN